MLPSTKALMDYMRDDGRSEEPEAGYEPAEESPEVRQLLTMQLKKKRQQMMLKQMLSDAGYSDLAKMVNIGRERYEVDDSDY